MRTLVGGMLAATVVLAGMEILPADAATAPAFWNKKCGPNGDCFVEQFAISFPQKSPVLEIRFDLFGGQGRARVIVIAPLGVSLPAGLTFALDEAKPYTLPYDRCVSTGCVAVATLAPDALTSFKKAKTLTVSYVPSDKGPFKVPVRLEGLSDALKSLVK